MNNEEREAQRELFGKSMPNNFNISIDGREEIFSMSDPHIYYLALAIWEKAIESQPKREIRLPEVSASPDETSSENEFGMAFGESHYRNKAKGCIEAQGFTVL